MKSTEAREIASQNHEGRPHTALFQFSATGVLLPRIADEIAERLKAVRKNSKAHKQLTALNDYIFNAATADSFTRVNNDVNGNPRYVIHFLRIVSDQQRTAIEKQADAIRAKGRIIFSITDALYKAALNNAKKIGGRKFNNKQYGGGIVFQSYNIHNTARDINELIDSL